VTNFAFLHIGTVSSTLAIDEIFQADDNVIQCGRTTRTVIANGEPRRIRSKVGLGDTRREQLPFERTHPRKSGTSMSITTVTRFHATEGKEEALLELQSEGRRRMLAADGCESFVILRDQADPRSSAFIQTWSSREAHDAAFGELIMESGHLEKVLGALDEGVVQTFYEVIS
jgi:quinol monooxygenase YgiN